MEKRLQRLDTFSAQGSDGQMYSVHAYEHLARVGFTADERWEPTGESEYKLADGRHVSIGADGAMEVAGVRLTRETRH